MKSLMPIPDPATGAPVGPICSVCRDKLPSSSIASKLHLASHDGKALWPCPVCAKNFSTRAFLRNHVKLHTGETPYQCNLCDKTFTFKQSYSKHMLYHSEERPHKCPECKKCFRESATLQNHRRIHTGEKPYACEDCGKRFRQRVACIVHRRVHTNETPYVCSVCKRSFRYKVSLRSHRCHGTKREPFGLSHFSDKSRGLIDGGELVSTSNPSSPQVSFPHPPSASFSPSSVSSFIELEPVPTCANETNDNSSNITLDSFLLLEADRLLGLRIDDGDVS